MHCIARGVSPCIVSIVLVVSVLPAAAQAPSQQPAAPAQRTLTLERAVALALRHNPDLAAAAREQEAAEGAVEQSGVFPNPELELSQDNFGNTRKRDAGDLTTSLQISQRLELGGKRAARVRVAESALDAAVQERRARRAEVLARVKQAFYDLLASQQRELLAPESAQLAGQVAAAVARRVQAGKASPVEETKARLAASSARVEREQAKRELVAARARLAALLGDDAPHAVYAEGDLEQLDSLPDFDLLASRVRASPALARWASELAQRRASVEAERAKSVPDITVRAGVTRFSVFDDQAYMIGISVPLPLFDRNRGAIIESNRRLDRALEERRSAQARLLAELADVYQRTAAVAAEVQALRDDILPGAKSAFDAAAKGYELGKFGILDVLDAQRTLFQARLQHLRALADYWRGASEIERLTGVAL